MTVQAEQLPSLLDAIVTLLRLSGSDEMEPDRLGEVAYILEKLLLDAACPPRVQFSALEGLEAVGKRLKSSSSMIRWDQTLLAIRKAAKSKKRAIRQKAAFVSNLWQVFLLSSDTFRELVPV